MSVEIIPTPYAFRNRILAGIEWINERAPDGWKYNLFGNINGEHIFKMSLLSATESVLPLAFKGQRLTTHMSHCGIASYFELSLEELISFGFHAGHMQYVPLVERAWEEVLREKIEEDEFFTEDGSLR
tara:strand:- start:3197 stop:3580 length:384 start_codon:yes stop_codon:yes gene_type:complete